jgi:hypothetical protein
MDEVIGGILGVLAIIAVAALAIHFIGKAQDKDDIDDRPCIPVCIEAMKATPMHYERGYRNRLGFCSCEGFVIPDGGVQ